jgi:hypothetical protein
LLEQDPRLRRDQRQSPPRRLRRIDGRTRRINTMHIQTPSARNQTRKEEPAAAADIEHIRSRRNQRNAASDGRDPMSMVLKKARE